MAVVLGIIAAYLLVGAIFAVAFVIRGAMAIDPAAASTPLRVRVLFAPGAVALWPVLIAKWLGSGRKVPHRAWSAH